MKGGFISLHYFDLRVPNKLTGECRFGVLNYIFSALQ